MEFEYKSRDKEQDQQHYMFDITYLVCTEIHKLIVNIFQIHQEYVSTVFCQESLMSRLLR